ncbi:MAG TPA: bifunctional 2-polyprenyl-6-hydroxyphenol methylase/3-demethylubiquinol 3-O-methyltransferase UbiG [Steroidobacteraceae bacterium]|nr:bifunctional 2-polyprenyl-6-hydroxyphenol methylase/3-demethylubiquinol 3-O-methyltransferase UbiG [Steroidobacteraceae bacterium]HRX89639.1 bifunctional 2-polyprenyl-6-hydroxyphenol methylase/3-demethylubiquinol 3-O-methyltransferase UbiG [Steroidobacteraceae bacterium]
MQHANHKSDTPARQVSADPVEIARFDASAHRFWDPDGEFKPLHQLNPVRLRFVAERAPLTGRAVLDVGCGGGLLAESLSRAGAQVTAIDLAPGMIETARLHAMEAGLEIDYRLTSIEELAAAEQRYDVVTCMEMLEHVPDPAATVRSLAAVLRPGGALFVSTINRTLKAFALAIVGAEYLTRLVARGTHDYERFIRPAELARYGRAAGLEVRDIGGLQYDPFTATCTLDSDPEVNYIMQLNLPIEPAPVGNQT